MLRRLSTGLCTTHPQATQRNSVSTKITVAKCNRPIFTGDFRQLFDVSVKHNSGRKSQSLIVVLSRMHPTVIMGMRLAREVALPIVFRHSPVSQHRHAPICPDLCAAAPRHRRDHGVAQARRMPGWTSYAPAVVHRKTSARESEPRRHPVLPASAAGSPGVRALRVKASAPGTLDQTA
jgi:hypothetical protein